MSLAAWRAARHQRAHERIRAALKAHPEESVFTIARCAGVGFGKLYVHLAEMEVAGEVTTRWQEGPHPRRRLYRLAAPTEEMS